MCLVLPLSGAEISDDLWDVSRGNVVTDFSPLYSGFSQNDMFGGNESTSAEKLSTIFEDNGADTLTALKLCWIEWETPFHVNLSGYSLWAPYGDRNITRFTLKADRDGDGVFETLVSDQNPWTSIYPEMLDSGKVVMLPTPIVAKKFRAEFYRMDMSGPRIRELDAITLPNTTSPELSVTSPQSGDTFEEGTPIKFAGRATDPDGMTRVDFDTYLDGSPYRIASVTTEPNFETLWENAPPGDYSVTIKAYDKFGAMTESSVVISITARPPTPLQLINLRTSPDGKLLFDASGLRFGDFFTIYSSSDLRQWDPQLTDTASTDNPTIQVNLDPGKNLFFKVLNGQP